jgi:hypothetical protein
MSLLADLQRDLQDASAAMAHAERTAIAHPNIPSVLATLRTIEARRRNLEEQFATAASAAGLDICSYRIEFDDQRQVTMSAITSTLGAFQLVFTSVYNSIINGPKQRFRPTEDIVNATAFGFGYTFPGSIGFMMTLPADRGLTGGSALHEAMGKTLRLLSVQNSGAVQEITEAVGLASVRLAHEWALENAKARLGADIQWKGQEPEGMRLRIQRQEIATLAHTIGSGISREQLKMDGELVHVNYFERTFEMRVGEETIKGTFANAISEEKPARVPNRYSATLMVNTRVALVDGRDEVTYFLADLEEPPPGGLFALSPL